MTQSQGEVPPVLEEVRDRRVGKVVAMYLAFAFAAIEATFTFMPMLATPDWARRVVLGVIVLGFPVSVVLAWLYDLTPGGVVRTPDDLSVVTEDSGSKLWLVVVVVGLIAGAAFHVMRG